MWELVFLIGVAVSVMICGVVPVMYRVRGENNPSPWSYSKNEAINEGITQNHATTQTIENVVTPTIPDFSQNVALSSSEVLVSVPNEELWSNVEKLLVETKDVAIFEEVEPKGFEIPIFKEQELVNIEPLQDTSKVEEMQSVPVLTDSQYDSIRVNYGERVASLITCTPYQGCLGEQVMIGTFFKDGNRLEFDQDWVELTNEFKDAINGEVIVVKGNFLADGKFYVQHWEDPMMLDAGYSSFEFTESLVQ